MQSKDGAWIGFIMLPFFSFVSQASLRYSWHALLVSYNMASDVNGDLESFTIQDFLKHRRRLKKRTLRFIRKQNKKE